MLLCHSLPIKTEPNRGVWWTADWCSTSGPAVATPRCANQIICNIPLVQQKLNTWNDYSWWNHAHKRTRYPSLLITPLASDGRTWFTKCTATPDRGPTLLPASVKISLHNVHESRAGEGKGLHSVILDEERSRRRLLAGISQSRVERQTRVTSFIGT